MKFPIIMIPWECRFGEIIESVISGIREDNEANDDKFVAIEKQLLLSYINSESLFDAAQIISDLFELPVIITNEILQIKGYSNSFRLEPKLSECLNTYNQTIKLILNKKLYGYIFFLFDNIIEQCDELESFIEKYAITPLTLWFDKEETINTTILRLKNDFVWSLISNTSDNYDDFLLNGKRLGFTIKASYTCIVCKMLNKSDNIFSREVYLNEWAIGNIVWDKSKKENNPVMFTLQNDKIIVFLKNTPVGAEKNVMDYIDNLESKLSNTFSFYDFYWGLSEIVLDNSNFQNLYHNAMFALNLSINSKGNKHNRITYKETIVYKIILELSKNEEQCALAQKILASLVDKSKYSDCNLLETLKVFIENNYNSSKTARDLHIHRQSLLYRMEKIEKLTNMSISNHTDLYVLETYLRLIYKF